VYGFISIAFGMLSIIVALAIGSEPGNYIMLIIGVGAIIIGLGIAIVWIGIAGGKSKPNE
jgi:hypothetical protein